MLKELESTKKVVADLMTDLEEQTAQQLVLRVVSRRTTRQAPVSAIGAQHRRAAAPPRAYALGRLPTRRRRETRASTPGPRYGRARPKSCPCAPRGRARAGYQEQRRSVRRMAAQRMQAERRRP